MAKKILRCIALPETVNETLEKLGIDVEDVISIVSAHQTTEHLGIGSKGIKRRTLEVWFKADVQ